MKVVKIVLISLGVLVILFFIGIVIFLRSFDLNAHVPEIATAASKAMGREVKIGRIDLSASFWGGVGLAVKDVSIADDPRFSSGPFLSVKKATFGVDVKALLWTRKVVISDITIDAFSVTIIRNKEGLINAIMMGPAKADEPAAPQQKETKGSSSAMPAMPALLVKDVRVSGGSFVYIDEMVSPKMVVSIGAIDAAIKNLSLTDPFTVAVKVALFSDAQDIDLNAKVAIDLKGLGATVSDMVLTADLGKIVPEKLTQAVPGLTAAGLGPMKGIVTVKVNPAVMNILGLTALKAEADLQKASFSVKTLPVPIEDVVVHLIADTKKIGVQEISCSLAGGTIKGRGSVLSYLASPQGQFAFEIAGIQAEKVSEAYKLPMKIKGVIQGGGDVSFSGKTPEEIMASLNLRAKADVKEGTLEGLGILQNAIAGIPVLSTVWSAVQADLPAETQDDLKKGSTAIERAGTDVQMQGPVLSLTRGELVTRDMAVSATGTVPLTGDMSIKADLFLAPKISDVFVAKASDMEALREEDGRIRIPIVVSGPLLGPKVQPDTQYLTQKLVVNRGKQELQKVLEKNPEAAGVLNALFGGKSSQSGSPSSAQDGTSSSSENDQGTSSEKAVGAIFNAIFDKK